MGDMVKGRQLTAAEKRRLLSKIRAWKTAEAELEDYLAELNGDGVSAVSLETATVGQGHLSMSHSTLHRMAVRARTRQDATDPQEATP